MLLKELKNQILNNHNFDNFIYNGKLINKSFIHKAKKDDLEEILKLLIEDKEKKEIINTSLRIFVSAPLLNNNETISACP